MSNNNNRVLWAGSRNTPHTCGCGRQTRRGMLVERLGRLFCGVSCASKEA